jgi:hypothetical protein
LVAVLLLRISAIMIAQMNVMNQVGISLSAVVGLIFAPTDIATMFVVVSMAGMLTFAWQRVNEVLVVEDHPDRGYHFAD